MQAVLRHHSALFASVGLLLLVLFLILASTYGHSSAVQPYAEGGQILTSDLVSNSQFVFGPAARQFDLTGYLRGHRSPLLADAGLIEGWCGYASINPQVVLVLLELDGEEVTHGWQTPLAGDERAAAVEEMVMGLAERFYSHLYRYGERAPAWGADRPEPSVTFADGSSLAVSRAVSSATFSILDTIAQTQTPTEFGLAVDPSESGSFPATWKRLFPGTDRLDASVSITPQGLPSGDLLQFPFPLGQKWWFNGAHNWNGSGATYGKPYSSMDFFTSAESCAAPPATDRAVAAASGAGYHPGEMGCWYRIDHSGGWTTSYYHLRNTVANGAVTANSNLGTIACETCAGGFATGPHVHLSLLYNGAYVDLEGVQLSGWTVHSGQGDYYSGSLARGGAQLKPYSAVFNDGVRPGTPTPTPSRTTTPTPGASRTPTVTPTVTATTMATAAPSSAPLARFVYPQANGLIRTCPVTLVAEVNPPSAAGEVRFWARYGGALHAIGADTNGSDGWQTTWDCQDTADGAATLSLSVINGARQEVISEGGATQVTLSKYCKEGTYRTAFFANAALSTTPASSWCKASGVSYNWGTGSPGAGVAGTDNFAARFRGDFRFEQGAYRFAGQSDDGVRVWVDRVLVLDDWHDHAAGVEPYVFSREMSAGLHEIWLDYYERSGTAVVALNWERTSAGMFRMYLPLVIQARRPQ